MQTQTEPRDPNVGKPLATAPLDNSIAHFRSVFASIGLREEKATGFLSCSGQVSGRNVAVSLGARSHNKYLTPDISRRVYTGMVLSVRIETSVSTRLLLYPAASKQRWLIAALQRVRGGTQLARLPGEFDRSEVWCSEPTWAEQFLGNPIVRSRFDALLEDDNAECTISWSPNRCTYMPANVPLDMTPEWLLSRIESMAEIVVESERNPPSVEAGKTWLEHQYDQGRLPLIIALGLVGGGLLLFVFLLVMIVTVVVLVRAV